MTCTAAESRAWRAKRRKASARLIQALKRAKPCSSCGRRGPGAELDGGDPPLLASERQIRLWIETRDLLCAACRRWRSWMRAWSALVETHAVRADPLVPAIPSQAVEFFRHVGAGPEAVAAARAAVERWESKHPTKRKRRDAARLGLHAWQVRAPREV